MSKSPRKNAIHRVSFCLSTYLVSVLSIMSRLTAYLVSVPRNMSRLTAYIVSVPSIMSRLTAYLDSVPRNMSRLTAYRNAMNRIISRLTAYRNAMNGIISRLTAYRNAMNRVISRLTVYRNAMNRVFTVGVLLLCLVACVSPSVVKVWSDEKHEVDSKKAHQYIFFVQSNNQINSRVAMDELVRLSTHKSIQGYLYTKGDPINPGNREYYKSKMKQDGYDYVVVMSLVDSAMVETTVTGGNPSSDKSFYGDYSFNIDPYAYNPSYERESKVFSIVTSVYYIETGNKVWVCESRVFNPSSIEQAVKETSKEVVKKMKRNGFMN